MQLDVEIANLGRLKSGTIHIKPLTILAGPNGTGKSFVTKSLYSILNVINKNVYYTEVSVTIETLMMQLDNLLKTVSYAAAADFDVVEGLKRGIHNISNLISLDSYENIQDYLELVKNGSTEVDRVINGFERYKSALKKKKSKFKSVAKRLSVIEKQLNELKKQLEESVTYYKHFLGLNLDSELRENFQVSNLGELVSFSEDKAVLKIAELGTIDLGSRGVGFSLGQNFIDDVSALSRVVFFESPAYWKVRDALLNSQKARFPFFLKKNENDILTGVPKYFYDLDSALRVEKKEPVTAEVSRLCETIRNELGGEFVFKGDELLYRETESGAFISKNLISFGMTNLGMIHALLKSNVITAGSFVFIDEPETNLHPEWQIALMNVLLELAKINVNIVIATHSVDMLKAIEVGLTRQGTAGPDLMAVHYFDTDGTLFEFESDRPWDQLIEAREELTAPYTRLFFQENSRCD